MKKEESGRPAKAARTGKPGKTGMKPMGAAGPKNKFFTPKSQVRVAAWNVRTGHHVGQKEIIAKELLDCKISIAAVSELRMIGSGEMTIRLPSEEVTMTFLYSGGEKCEAGVGFAVDNRTIKSTLAFQPISDRLAVLTVDGTIRTHVLSVYAPTEGSSESVKDDFYNQLQRTLDSIAQTDVIIIAGDFNAHTGADRRGWESSMGKFGHGSLNDNGLRLLTLATTNNFIVGNSQF